MSDNDVIMSPSATKTGETDHDIVPAHLAVKAMRDNGYKNAAYAIAELMDNSIQAGADCVELLCGEHEVQLETQTSRRINKIGVLDNGSGMDAAVLRLALQFGNGTHLDSDEQNGIGKFGMGLPSSSMSQCRRVDVWTWQDGVESAIHTHLDLDAILNKEMRSVPSPDAKPIPDVWAQRADGFGESGTLVVWSSLDRVMWKTARAIIRNSEMLIGRMYRHFLAEGKVSIRMKAFDVEKPQKAFSIEEDAVPNDPMYLMENTSCPWENEPMFEPWGDPHVITIEHEGGEHDVSVSFSVAKDEAREMAQAGAQRHGQHAKKNIGVSVVRAGRELEMNQTWVNSYDPRDRWWGVEVHFPPALDTIFGVSNNKQSARHFEQFDTDGLKLDGESITELKERLEQEDDPAGPLFEVSRTIDRNLSVLRDYIKSQREGTRGAEKRHEDTEAEERATQETEKRKNEGNIGSSDADEDNLDPDEKREQLEESLQESGMSETAAKMLAGKVVDKGLKYTFAEVALSSSAPMFSVNRKAGTIIVQLNTKHPGYDALISALEDEGVDDIEDLRRRLQKARMGLRLLLLAWARYEDEQNDIARDRVQDTRHDWGRIARQFLRDAE